MKMRLATASLLFALLVTQAFAAEPSPTVRCDGIYVREDVDRDWHVRIAGTVTSPAGVYVVVTNVEGKVIFRGSVPRGTYPLETPHQVRVPKDGLAGDYLLTIFGTQGDFAGLLTPYTDLPFEVYGKTFFHVIRQGAARSRPYTQPAPSGLYFQLTEGAEELTITQGEIVWRIHALDGSVIYDVGKDGKVEVNPNNNRKTSTGTFKGTPGTTYILGHELYWFYAKPELFLAVSPQRWFIPDPKLKLDPTWWRQSK